MPIAGNPSASNKASRKCARDKAKEGDKLKEGEDNLEQAAHLDAVELVALLPVRLLALPAAVPLHLAARALHQLLLVLAGMAGRAVPRELAHGLQRLHKHSNSAAHEHSQDPLHAGNPSTG